MPVVNKKSQQQHHCQKQPKMQIVILAVTAHAKQNNITFTDDSVFVLLFERQSMRA